MNVSGLSIQRRLRLIIMVTTTIALLLAGGASVVFDFISLGQITERDMNALSNVIAIDSTAPLTFRDIDAAREILTSLRAKPSVVEAAIFDRSGLPFVTYSRQGNFVPGSLRHLTEAPSTGSIQVYTDIIFDGEKIGTLYICASRDMVKTRLRQYILVLVGILAVALVVTFILSSRLPKVVSEPIAGLASVAREITRGDNYGLRAGEPDPTSPREVRDLVATFNQMLTEIQRHRDDLEQQVQARTSELSILVDRNQAILDSAGEGIFGLDLNGTVTFMNPSAARILGSGMTLVGASLHAHIHSATCPDRVLPYRDCRVCGARLDPPVRTGRGKFNRFDNGSVSIEYTSSTIVDEQGKPNGVVVTFRDISVQLAVERMKDEFVSTVSHELRTPLTSIRGALGLLGSGLLGNVEQRAQRMLDIAVTNTDRLVRLINDILDLERIDSGRVELNRGAVEAGDLMFEAIEGIQSFADRAEVTVTAEPSRVLLWADHDRVIQTLTNLLSNAVKFSPDGTIVSVKATGDGGMCTFSIEDQGRGIPKDQLESVFERFKQVDASDSREKGGTGLGLAICRSIVSAHGGRIWAESEAGRGTTFRFTIPLHEETAVNGPEVSPTDIAPDRPAVLIVEDDNDLARVIGASLEGHGLRTRHVASGRCALAACQDEVPDVVILDLILPELNGFEVVQWMRTQPRLARVPLVVYSAHEVSPSDQERLRLGQTTFFTKSRVSPEEFEDRVMELLATVGAGQEVAGAA